jgi:hypothetical protein
VTTTIAPRLEAFLDALPHAGDDEFVTAPGLGVFRAKHIRRGMDKGVLAVHWTGAGMTLVQPPTHGICHECARGKGALCDHCACPMCAWFRISEERASPKVSREKMLQLVARLKAFQFGGPKPAVIPALDEEF